MRAVVFEDVGRVGVAEVPDAVVEEPGDAVVRVTLGAICGSDLHFLHGKAPVAPGESLGHEAVGVVQAVGEGVTRFHVGRPRGGGVHDRVRRLLVLPPGADPAVRAAPHPGGGRLRRRARRRAGGPPADPGGRRQSAGDPRRRRRRARPVRGRHPHQRRVRRRAGFGGPDDVVAVVGAGPVGYFCAQAARALRRGAGVRARTSMPSAWRGPRPRAPSRSTSPSAIPPPRWPMPPRDGAPTSSSTRWGAWRRSSPRWTSCAAAGAWWSWASTPARSAEVQLGVYWARALDLRFAGITPVHTWWERAMAAIVDGTIDPLPIISHRLPAGRRRPTGTRCSIAARRPRCS